jgi:hypothetical protein
LAERGPTISYFGIRDKSKRLANSSLLRLTEPAPKATCQRAPETTLAILKNGLIAMITAIRIGKAAPTSNKTFVFFFMVSLFPQALPFAPVPPFQRIPPADWLTARGAPAFEIHSLSPLLSHQATSNTTTTVMPK